MPTGHWPSVCLETELKRARMRSSNLKMSWEAGNSSLLDYRICYSSDWKKWLRSLHEYTGRPVWIATNEARDWNVHKWRWNVRERKHTQRPQTSGTQTRSTRADAWLFLVSVRVWEHANNPAVVLSTIAEWMLLFPKIIISTNAVDRTINAVYHNGHNTSCV